MKNATPKLGIAVLVAWLLFSAAHLVRHGEEMLAYFQLVFALVGLGILVVCAAPDEPPRGGG